MKTNFTFAILILMLLSMTNIFSQKVTLKESQIIKNTEEPVYKMVRLMLFHTESQVILKKEDMENIISAFCADQKISPSEKAVLDQLQGEMATFAIESPYNKNMLLINKKIETSATIALNFFWDRMNENRSDRDMVANYLYLHLPGRFFEYYYFNDKNENEMTSILKEYLDYVCRNSDKNSWSLLKEELNRIYAQINIGNKTKEEEFRKIVANCYKETKDKYDTPKMNLALLN